MQFTAVLCVFVVAAGLASAFPLAEYAEADRYPYADVQSMGYEDDKVPSSEVEEYFKIQTDPSSDGAAVHYPYMPGVYEDARRMEEYNDGPGMQAFPDARINYYPSIQDDDDEEEEEEEGTEMPDGNEGPGMQAFPNARMNYYPAIQDDKDDEQDMMSEFFGEQNAKMNYFDPYMQEKEGEMDNNEGPGMQAFPNARMNYYPAIQDDEEEEEEEEEEGTEMPDNNEGPGMQAFPNVRMNYYPAIQDDKYDEQDMMSEFFGEQNAKMNYFDPYMQEKEGEIDNNEGPGMQAFPNARMNYYPAIQDDDDDDDEEEGEEMPDNNEGPGMQAFPNARMNYFQGEEDPGMQEFEAFQDTGDDSEKLIQEFDSYLESIPEEQADKIIDYFGRMQAPSPYKSAPTNNQGKSEEEAMEEYIAQIKNVPSRPKPVSRADIEEYFQQDD